MIREIGQIYSIFCIAYQLIIYKIKIIFIKKLNNNVSKTKNIF